MWIKYIVFVCCMACICLAAESKKKPKEEVRGKRNLEYSISHSFPNNYRLERRISSFPQLNTYPSFAQGLRTYSYGSRKRTNSLTAPPYAVQMEPLVQYSQRDPLYDSSKLFSTFSDGKSNDLLTDNNHLSERIYGPQYKHVIERPVYIKEPEPIIEIIIKESNVTLPPPPVVAPPPKKKEEVQVFYVKYKKNPHGTGKNAVIYDKPIPALSPIKHEETSGGDESYHVPEVATLPPPPSTTLRAIIKPESEQYHTNTGVHVTFGSEHNVHDKASHDDADEESAPHPSIALPQTSRTFDQPLNFKRPPPRTPEPYRPFNQPPPPPPPFGGRNFSPFPRLNHQLPNPPPPSNSFNRNPVPYKPFEQQTPPPPFSRPQTHFPVHQQPPLPQQNNIFNQQLAQRAQNYNIQHGHPNSNHIRFPPPNPPNNQAFPPQNHNQHPPNFPQNQQPPNNQPHHDFHQPNVRPNPPNNFQPFQQPPSQFPHQNQFNQPPQQQHNQPPPRIIPPGGELIASVPKYEQHISVNTPSFGQGSNLQPQATTNQFNQNVNQNRPLNQQFNNQNQQQPNQNQQFNHNQFKSQNQFGQPQQQFAQNQQHLNQNQQHQSQSQQHSTQNQQHPGQNQQHPSQNQQHPSQNQQHPSQNQQHPSQNQQHPSQNQQHLGQNQLHSASQYSTQNQQQLSGQNQQQFGQNQQQFGQSNQQFGQNHQQFGQSHQQSVQVQQQQSLSHQIGQFNSPSGDQNAKKNNDQFQQNFQQNQHINFQSQFENQKALPSQTNQVKSTFGQFSSNQQSFNNPDYHISGKSKHEEQLLALNSQNQFLNQNFAQIPQNAYNGNSFQNTSPKPTNYVTSAPLRASSVTPAPTTTTTTEKPLTEDEKKKLSLELPDEVPDDLREQLLSSGILANAQISILDYDKVGDIPLSALPPDQLANFYGAGGAQQIASAGSEPVPKVVDKDGKSVDSDLETDASEYSPVESKVPVQMKVVHYDPQSENGKQVQESYVKDDATQVDPVVLNDQKYTRYLPLKVSGSQFPIPDVPELKGKSINSVVVLAPVDYKFPDASRPTRDAKEIDEVKFLTEGRALKELLENPTMENYYKWLDSENKTSSDKQSVILLVTGDNISSKAEREIFMYDVATQTVSKLSGELSAAFVDAAESNVGTPTPNTNQQQPSASNVVETRIPIPDGFSDRSDFQSSASDLEEPEVELDPAASELIESRVPIIDPMEEQDQDGEASEQLETFVDVTGLRVQPQEDLTASASDINSIEKQIFISNSYSKTGHSNLPS